MYKFFSYFGHIPRSGIADHMIIADHMMIHQTAFYSGCTILNSYQRCMKTPLSYIFSKTYFSLYLFFKIIASWVWGGISLWFYLHFLNGLWYWATFHVLLSHVYIFFDKMSLQLFCSFKKTGLCIFLLLSCKSSLYIWPLNIYTYICNYLSPFCMLSFHFLDGVLWYTSLFWCTKFW